MEAKDLGTSSTGMQPNVAALLSYLVGFVTGIIFYLIEKDNKFVRFHALQSAIVFGGLAVINVLILYVLSSFIPWAVRSLISSLINLMILILWIVLMIKAYQGEYFKVPIVGDIAEQNA